MPRHIRIHPYDYRSVSAKKLKEALLEQPEVASCKFIKRQNSTYAQNPEHTIINWGATNSSVPLTRVINGFNAVKIAINKLQTFEALRQNNVPHVKWSYDIENVFDWLREDFNVIARKTSTGRGGRGIVCYTPTDLPRLAAEGDELEDYLFFTKHFGQDREYRIHVWCGEVLDVAQKLRRRGVEGDLSHELVRSHGGYWVFCRNCIQQPYESTLQNALNAVQACGLDFGAVDMLERNNGDVKSVVCEVNTAPGLKSPTVLRKYTTAILALEN